jgi:hypothetical protein
VQFVALTRKSLPTRQGRQELNAERAESPEKNGSIEQGSLRPPRPLLRKYYQIPVDFGVGVGIDIGIETEADPNHDPDADRPKLQNIAMHLGATPVHGRLRQSFWAADHPRRGTTLKFPVFWARFFGPA